MIAVTDVLRRVVVAAVILPMIACERTPTGPQPELLSPGRWSDGGACLSVSDQGCDLVVGCGHGQFPRPNVGRDGSFAIAGTYRIEAGPIGINPAPPAQFFGAVAGDTLTITVIPTAASLNPASYKLQRTNVIGRCVVPCL